MGQIRVTSGTDLAVRFLLMFIAIILIAAISAVIAPAVQYVFSDIGKNLDTATFCVAAILFVVFLAIMPGNPDVHMAALSTFIYVLEVHKIFLTWQESKACSNLFSNNGYDTWYPLTDVAKLPRAERKAAIFHVAKKTGRIIEPLSTKEKSKEIAKKLVILSIACLAWLIFIGFGAVRHSYSFDVSGFFSIGVMPVLASLIGFGIYKLALKNAN